MSTKKKLWISIGALCVAIVAGLGITFGVLAAQTQKVSNNFEVEYKAINVNATVTASFATKNGETDSDTYRFVPTDNFSTTPKTLELDKAQLTADDNYVVYTYTFKNENSGTNTRGMKVALTDNSTAGTNVTITYATNNNGSTPTFGNTKPAQTGSELSVAAGQTAYVYVKVQITDDTLDSSYSLNLSWTLTALETGSQG